MIDKKLEALSVMDSQFVEGGCCIPDENRSIPKDKEELLARREQVKKRFAQRFEAVADEYRAELI